MKHRMKALVKKIASLCILLLLKNTFASAQVDKKSIYPIDVEIIKIDTVQLKKSADGLPSDLTLAKIISIKIIKSGSLNKKKISPFFVIELTKGEHKCDFDFQLHNHYRIKASIAKYSSLSISEKYRHWSYRLDCLNLPIKLK